MILRNIAVRHGRRALAAPLSRSALRRYSTQTPGPTDTDTPAVTVPSETTAAWSTSQAAKQAEGTPKPVRTSRRKQFKYVQEKIMSLGIDSGATHQGRSWSRAHEFGDVQMTPKEQWQEFQRLQRATKNLGTSISRRYQASDLVNNPPEAENLTLELLMASQTHMGHNTSKWNPANSRYIYGVREGTHIISLETTLAHLRRAARVVEEVAYRGGLVLFVGTRPGQMEVVTSAAERAGGYHVFTKWAPGSITNRDVMLQGHQTKVVDEWDKRLQGFDMYNITSSPLVPDLVVCLNPLENYTLLHECGLKTIPTIGIIDTDADPTWVTYTIPANDDSLRSVGVIAGVLGRAGGRGQARRKHDTKMGRVPWQTSEELTSFMSAENSAALRKRKEVMGQTQKYEDFSHEEMQLINQQEAGGAAPMTEDAMLEIMGQASAADSSSGEVRGPVSAESIESQLDAALAMKGELEKGPQQ